MKKKVLFIDRDGTIIKEPADEQIDTVDKLDFLAKAISTMARIYQEMDYEFVMITNQDGLGTDSFPEDDFWPAHNVMMRTLASEGIAWREVLIDRSFSEDKLDTRKPGIGLLKHYQSEFFDLEHSYVIGDRWSDVELARNLGCQSIYIGDEPSDKATVSCTGWAGIWNFLQSHSREVRIERKTKETAIEIMLNLDQSAGGKIDTGLNFFDHMLEQIQRHADIYVDISVDGDLEIDEHHTIEDTALALGQALRQALGSKYGIERYAFVLPMDEALAQVSIDFGGRPELQWDVSFVRDRVGDVPTELWKHFFKSLCDTAACNLHISSTAENDHHRIESIFKGFARCLKTAISKTSAGIPSTKGTI